MPKMTMRDAIREALHEEMARDETIFVLGEDVIAHGGPYAVTRGIAEKFPGRIRQTPISEAGIVGTALGAAGLTVGSPALALRIPLIELFLVHVSLCNTMYHKSQALSATPRPCYRILRYRPGHGGRQVLARTADPSPALRLPGSGDGRGCRVLAVRGVVRAGRPQPAPEGPADFPTAYFATRAEARAWLAS